LPDQIPPFVLASHFGIPIYSITECRNHVTLDTSEGKFRIPRWEWEKVRREGREYLREQGLLKEQEKMIQAGAEAVSA
jgi:hypothetical protein